MKTPLKEPMLEASPPPIASTDASNGQRHRRPSGEAPPLPRPLRTSGKLMLVYMGLVFLLLIVVGLDFGLDAALDRWEATFLGWIATFRTPMATTWMNNIADGLGSVWLLATLRVSAVLGLLALKRFRHLVVFLGSILAVGLVTTSISMVAVRARPVGIPILGEWLGSSLPSRPVAALAATLLGITYGFFVPGRPRNLAKI